MQINAKFFQNSKILYIFFFFSWEQKYSKKSPAGGDVISYSFKSFSGEILTKSLGDEEKEDNPTLGF